MMFTPFEPKVNFRYKLHMNNIPVYMIKTSALPSFEQGEIIIDYINVDFIVKGKSRWQDISVTLYDPITPSGAEEVHNWIRDFHHNSETGIDGYAFPAGSGYKRDIKIEVLDPKGVPVETWSISGAFISSANWGSMDWSSEDAKMIELKIKYDDAVLS